MLNLVNYVLLALLLVISFFFIKKSTNYCCACPCSMVMGNSAADTAHAVPPSSVISSMSEMPVSPTSVTSSGHFPFTTSDMSGIGVDSSALDTAFSDVASSVGLQLGPDGGAGNSRSLDHFQWNFSLSDIAEDLSNLGGKLFIILVTG